MFNFFKKRREQLSFSEALAVVTKTLREDDGLFQTYQSNLAMSFHDECKRSRKVRVSRANLHQISNQAATNFLRLWVNEQQR